ncbi:hypothetical protein [Mangrovicoccus sp. HB161399]|uniref:hypothetical protein n=1 Tax=Mangrovicoccus sp. HB161399 TaxID=2720392 RepID=UPI0015518836|nr:hypothetical protein [Mangrovicoccus sp. HB161399]
MTDHTRLGGAAELCFRPLIPGTRLVPAEKLRIHPAAESAFEVFRSIRVSARLATPLADPVLAVRMPRGAAWFFGAFQSRLAYLGETIVPVLMLDALPDDEIARCAWAETLLLCHGQLHPRTGFRDLARAITRLPQEVRDPVLGAGSNRDLARHLCCDVSRFREERT